MKLTFPEWLTEAEQTRLLTDPAHEWLVPIGLWGPLLRLADGEKPVAAVVEGDIPTGHSTWEVIWLTPRSIVYVKATKNRDSWNGYQTDEDAGTIDQFEGWARPVTSIVSRSLSGVTAQPVKKHGEGYDWYWSATTNIEFADTKQLSLAQTEGRDKHYIDAVDVFLTALDEVQVCGLAAG